MLFEKEKNFAIKLGWTVEPWRHNGMDFFLMRITNTNTLSKVQEVIWSIDRGNSWRYNATIFNREEINIRNVDDLFNLLLMEG